MCELVIVLHTTCSAHVSVSGGDVLRNRNTNSAGQKTWQQSVCEEADEVESQLMEAEGGRGGCCQLLSAHMHVITEEESVSAAG